MQTPPPPPPSPYYKGSGGSRQNYTEKDYEEIFYHFDDYAQAVIMANATRFIDPTEPAEHYEYEEEILDEVSEYEIEGMKKSFYFGFASTVSSFVLLRWRRRRMNVPFGGLSKYASRSSTRSSGGYKFDPIHQHQPSSMNSVQHASSSGTKPPRSGFFTDVALSALLGMGLSLLAVENDLFYPTGNSSAGDDNGPPLMSITPPPQWISHQIPLVPGKSLISETLCQPLTEEFKKFPKELWQSGNHRGIENGYNNHIALYANGGWKDTKYYNSNPNASVVSLGEKHNESKRKYEDSKNRIYEHLVVDSLQGFIINCERRARYEQKLRKLKNIPERTYPIIPPSGVPANEELELDDIYLMEEKSDDDNDDGFYNE
uniref:Uncharacterized protein n=1 Tax=Skeletonema marinoi TaxID=267567 RepID=A0A7S2PAV4_9STRA|mmetsp:Transcript_17594/g.29724  ORF Transcript_17594/g.29724 Transcript_17594/m.29724 type:complete len:373 (+) Transcript_17594:81-1199(+)